MMHQIDFLTPEECRLIQDKVHMLRALWIPRYGGFFPVFTLGEASYLDAISLAERQCARLFQLRASASLAGLWRDQGRHKEASGADDGK